MAKIHRFEASLIEVCQGYAQRVDAFDLGQFWAGPEAILDESLSRVQVNWHRCFQLNRLIKAGEDGSSFGQKRICFSYLFIRFEALELPLPVIAACVRIRSGRLLRGFYRLLTLAS